MSDATQATGSGVESRRRTHERRVGLARLARELAQVVSGPSEPRGLRRTLETFLVDRLPLAAAQLRDRPSRTISRPNGILTSGDFVGIRVPTREVSRPAALELRLSAGRRLDDWDMDLLHAAASLGTLVIEFEHLLRRDLRASGQNGDRPDGAAPLIGSSAVMKALRERIERVAGTDFTILIEGESGTGKELVARQIHELSPRAKGPFVAINCAALVETLLEAELFGIEDRTATGVRGRRGKFEHADGGTLFLDEVSDLSLSAQAKLLRAIQDLAVERVGGCGVHRVDTRIVVATNRSLSELVERGLFRPDLYYRLSGVELHVPPLRTRREDLLELARYFLDRHRSVRRLELSPAAADGLRLYDWPGNVRELERVIEAVVALAESDTIELDDLPPAIRGAQAEVLLPSLLAGDSMRDWGSRYARLVLDRCGQNKRRACRALKISYHTLQAYLHHHRDAPGAAPGSPGPDGPPEWPEEELEESAPVAPVSVVVHETAAGGERRDFGLARFDEE